MIDLFAHPAVQSGILPFSLSACIVALLGFSGAQRFAGLAVALGFGTAYVATFGWPAFLPHTSGQKIAYVAILAATYGVATDTQRLSFAQRIAGAGTLVVLVTVWIAWRKMWAAPSFDHVLALLIMGGGVLAVWATERTAKDSADPIVSLLAVCLGFAGLAFFGASASIAQNALGLAAALGGVMVLNWPRRRFGLSAQARLVPVVVLVALATQVVFFTKAPAWTLALVLPALFAQSLAQRWLPADGARSALARPIILTILTILMLVPAVAAAWYMSLSSALDGGY